MQRGLLICENGEGDAAPMYIGGETPINSIRLAAMINTSMDSRRRRVQVRKGE
jgi:hypothetical protein